MESIIKFINEALIKKDTKLDQDYYKDETTPKYKKGDKCLYLEISGTPQQRKVTIDAIQINKVTKTLLGFDFLTSFGVNFKKKNFQIKIKKNSMNPTYYPCASGPVATIMIIDKNNVEKILELIEKFNYKIRFYQVLFNDKSYTDLTQIKQIKDKSVYNSSDNFEDITQDTIDEIRKTLNI